MAPAEAPDTFFRYKSGAYLHIVLEPKVLINNEKK